MKDKKELEKFFDTIEEVYHNGLILPWYRCTLNGKKHDISWEIPAKDYPEIFQSIKLEILKHKFFNHPTNDPKSS